MRTQAHPNQLDLYLPPAEPVVSAREGVVVARLVIPARQTARSQPKTEKRVDWFKVITGLTNTGYSLNTVSAAVGVARTTLIGWKQGAEPRYTEGERLVSFWSQVTGRDRSKLPMVAVGDWWAYHSKA
ncbi:hypothetical protein IB241_15730 [Pseudomonas sp. PDM05]|uniref:hypothetical protein n=1 Tax=Pseudomonas sp. PDM05 TaxID=2769301 RepID=UPI00177FD049|nr:hypothetical protein [Pseudomonas sp. PDM05]MBD9459133.1 hypothetical protein [Pseudomonas sp. PDM05]